MVCNALFENTFKSLREAKRRPECIAVTITIWRVLYRVRSSSMRNLFRGFECRDLMIWFRILCLCFELKMKWKVENFLSFFSKCNQKLVWFKKNFMFSTVLSLNNL